MNSSKVSIVIRNKNESSALSVVLKVLRTYYQDSIAEIIIVDNMSSDNSLKIAQEFDCKVVSISEFSYGGALNVGIEMSASELVLLLSAHSVPIGKAFFRRSIERFIDDESLAGLRFVNSFSNYERFIRDNGAISNVLNFGLTASCSMIRKSVWKTIRFDDKLKACEDKDWSVKVTDCGFKIAEINETYFYHIKRSVGGIVNRYENETRVHHQLAGTPFYSKMKIISGFLIKVFLKNFQELFHTVHYDILMLRANLKLNKTLGVGRNDK